MHSSPTAIANKFFDGLMEQTTPLLEKYVLKSEAGIEGSEFILELWAYIIILTMYSMEDVQEYSESWKNLFLHQLIEESDQFFSKLANKRYTTGNLITKIKEIGWSYTIDGSSRDNELEHCTKRFIEQLSLVKKTEFLKDIENAVKQTMQKFITVPKWYNLAAWF